jgi:hypothetical protein
VESCEDIDGSVKMSDELDAEGRGRCEWGRRCGLRKASVQY